MRAFGQPHPQVEHPHIGSIGADVGDDTQLAARGRLVIPCSIIPEDKGDKDSQSNDQDQEK